MAIPDLDVVSQDLGHKAKTLIDEVCAVAWTRLPGSAGEHDAQQFLATKLETLGADTVETREFKVRQRFFRWWPEISVALFYASLVAYLFVPLLALATCVLMVLNLVFKIFSYSFLDVLFRNKPSSNVIGKLRTSQPDPDGKPKRVVLVGGHTDSNYEYPIGRKFGADGMTKIILPVLGIMLFWLLATLVNAIVHLVQGAPFLVGTPGLPAWPFWVAIAAAPYVSWVGLRMVSSLPVAGANDNLSGVSVALMLLDHLAHHPGAHPKHVEYWATCFGSEEGGMRGSKTMARDVRAALDAGTFPADEIWVVNFDSVGVAGPLHIATKEPMYRVSAYDPAVYTQLAASAERAGVDHYVKSLTAGGTDSAPFGRLDIPAAAILCFGNEANPPNWHTREDVPDNIEPAGLANVIKVMIQFIHDVDASLEPGAGED